MRAVRITGPGGPDVLRVEEVDEPEPGPDDVLIEVRAAALNRADLLQRAGAYPAPPGWPADVPGLECAGVVVGAGRNVRSVEEGDRVMALLGGGGYAERVAVHAGMTMPVPERLDFREAAAVPEVFFTAYDALFRQGRAGPGDRVIVHGAGGGVGTAALQLADMGGCTVFATASGPKLEALERLGLPVDVAVDYRRDDFARVVDRETAGRGVDVILDVVGAEHWDRNVAALAERGRLVLVGLLGGRRAEVDLGALLRGRLTVVGTVLRSRPIGEKLELAREVRERVLPALASGALRPILDRTYPLEAAAEAHRRMGADRNVGKIVLEVDAP